MADELDMILKAAAFAAAWIGLCWWFFGRAKK
jgi:hypothetical protein